MKIIVVGCGKVGAALTAQLSQEGHDIAVIDVDSGVVTDISNNYDVLGLVGNGASHAVQMEAGIESADLLIAATDSDELNLLCCLIAKKAGGCNTIARVRNPVYNGEIDFIKEELGQGKGRDHQGKDSRRLRAGRLPAGADPQEDRYGRADLHGGERRTGRYSQRIICAQGRRRHQYRRVQTEHKRFRLQDRP